MSEEYGNDFLTITDEEGNEFELEHLDTTEVDGCLYMAFLPADMDENDEDFGMIILKVISEDDEEVLVTVDDDNELNIVYARFLERLSDDEES